MTPKLTTTTVDLSKTRTAVAVEILVGEEAELATVGLDLSVSKVTLESTKIRALVTLVGRHTFSRTTSDHGIAGLVEIPNVAATDSATLERVAFVNRFCTAVNGMPAPHSTMQLRGLLQLPAASSFLEHADSTGLDPAARDELGAAFLLSVATASLAVH